MLEEANSTTSEIGLVKPPPEFEKRVLSVQQLNQHNFQFGELGEKKAVIFLKNNGFEIIERNIKIAGAEIDIIALDEVHQELVFIEVKLRTRVGRGSPSLAVDRAKLNKIARAAEVYIWKKKLQLDYRFDIIAITGKDIRHFENVSWGF